MMIEKGTEVNLGVEETKAEVVNEVDRWIYNLGFEALEINDSKPWGAYWKIDDERIEMFVDIFFPEIKSKLLKSRFNLSPKFLLVAPGEKLSWQYHHRRSEEWRVVAGSVRVEKSDNDEEPAEAQVFGLGENISLGVGERHRLIGGESWGLVAEVWVHVNANTPSDEEDIVRLKDDYARI
ncbi:MAG: phosphoheptose isomerase [Candidatus Doudnabacteria bacterium]